MHGFSAAIVVAVLTCATSSTEFFYRYTGQENDTAVTLKPNEAIISPVRCAKINQFTSWGNVDRCPPNHFVTRFQVKSYDPEKNPNHSDAFRLLSLTGIRFFCNKIGHNKENIRITSRVMGWGEWGNVFDCEKGVFIGLSTGVVTPIQNLYMRCSSKPDKLIKGDAREKIVQDPNAGLKRQCRPRQALCGIQTLTEYEEDFTVKLRKGIIHIRAICCDVVNPAKNCKPTDTWTTINEQENQATSGVFEYSFEYTIGSTEKNLNSSSASSSSEIAASVGFSASATFGAVTASMSFSHESSFKTGWNWKKTSGEEFQKTKHGKLEYKIQPGLKYKVQQAVGSCWSYSFQAEDFRLIEA